MIRSIFATATALLGLALAPQAAASTITIRVTSDGGRPVRDAVVTLKPVDRPGTAPQSGGSFRIEQKDMQFRPFLTIIPVNSKVLFPNLDPTQHHVYSFSAAKRFELKLYAKDQQRSVHFDKPGAIAIGCNIHDAMRAYIFVTDTAWTARTDANGNVTFRNAPAGAIDAAVWHPYLRAPGATQTRRISGNPTVVNEAFAVKLRPPPLQGTSRY